MTWTSTLLRTKAINADHPHGDTGLSRVLGPLDLTLLGIGAIIGAGLGELVAWIIGWDLILEYGVAVSAVAIGWSEYANNALEAVGLGLPAVWLHGPAEGGLLNLPAAAIVLTLALLLGVGIRESVRVNGIMVLIKLLAIAVFLAVAVGRVDPANWVPFMPFGWNGVMGGAALIFFAYIGFDAVSTAAEEARHPQRDLPIGILVSLTVCTLIYILVAAVLTGVVPYPSLNVGSPVADVMLRVTQPDLPRPFRTPWSPLVPLLGAASCLYLALSLPWVTWLRFGLWLAVGLAIYVFYSRHHSALAAQHT